MQFTSYTPLSLKPLALIALGLLTATVQAEQTNPAQKYNAPTRGFFIEQGTVNGAGKASVELHTGNHMDQGGGIRLGLPRAELIINSGFGDDDENELLVKWGMRKVNPNNDGKSVLNWAVLGGISHLDVDDDEGNPNTDFDRTSLKLGAAVTIAADAGTFTISPMAVYADDDDRRDADDTFFELGLGGYVGVIDTQSGLFSLGLEAILTSEDDTDNTVAFGGRWSYNSRVNLDFVPIILSDEDTVGIPGLVRLNMVF